MPAVGSFVPMIYVAPPTRLAAGLPVRHDRPASRAIRCPSNFIQGRRLLKCCGTSDFELGRCAATGSILSPLGSQRSWLANLETQRQKPQVHLRLFPSRLVHRTLWPCPRRASTARSSPVTSP